MSASRTISSNLNPTSQCPKVSIGIMVDKTPKTVSGAMQEEQYSLHFKEQFPSHEKLNGEGSEKKVISKGEKSELKINNSPWVSTRSRSHVKPVIQTIHFFQNQASILKSGDEQHMRPGLLNCEIKRVNDGTVDRVEKAAMQESHMSNKGRVDERAANASSEALKRKLWEVLGSAPSQGKKILSSQTTIGNTNDMAKEQNGGCNGGEKGNRKLSDTIETDSEVPVKTVSRPVTRSLAQKKQAPRHSSSGFQSKKANMQKQLSSTSKQKKQLGEKRVFSFDGQERVGASNVPAPNNLPKITNSNTRNILRVEPRRLSFSRKSASSKSKQDIERECASSPPVNLVPKYNVAVSQRNSPVVKSLGNTVPVIVDPDKLFPDEKERTPSLPPPAAVETAAVKYASPESSSFGGTFSLSKAKSNIKHQANLIPEKVCQNPQTESHESPCDMLLPKTENQKNHPLRTDESVLNKRKYPTLLTSVGRNEIFCSPPKSGDAQQLNSHDSPISAVNFKIILSEERMIERTSDQSTLPSPASNIREFSYEGSSLKSPSPVEDTEMESSINTRDPTEVPSNCARHRLNDKDSKENFQRSGTDEPYEEIYNLKENFQMSWMNEPSKENYEINDIRDKVTGFRLKKWFPDIGCKKKYPIFLCRGGRFDVPEDVTEDLNPSSIFMANSKTEEINETPETMEQLPESLLRAISHLAMIFEQIKTKIKLHANKRNSEILSSVEDKIQLQLLDIESQIQADLRKFTCLAKSKRKHLESAFHAQHEKLKAINEKFKEEVSQHLLECRGTLEELEAFRMESKGTAERQRLLNRKLMMQMEEAMEFQLSDAERSIVAIQRVARKKMNGLKHYLRELLDEGTLSQ